jgi:hypothetical protein
MHNLFADLLAHVKLQNAGYFRLWLADEQTPNETRTVRYHSAHQQPLLVQYRNVQTATSGFGFRMSRHLHDRISSSYLSTFQSCCPSIWLQQGQS